MLGFAWQGNRVSGQRRLEDFLQSLNLDSCPSFRALGGLLMSKERTGRSKRPSTDLRRTTPLHKEDSSAFANAVTILNTYPFHVRRPLGSLTVQCLGDSDEVRSRVPVPELLATLTPNLLHLADDYDYQDVHMVFACNSPQRMTRDFSKCPSS